MMTDLERLALCSFTPVGDSAWPSGSLFAYAYRDGSFAYSFELAFVSNGMRNRYVSGLLLGAVDDVGSFVRALRWLEAWYFAGQCKRYLQSEPGVPRYTLTQTVGVEQMHLEPIRRAIGQQHARMTNREEELDHAPSPDEITDIVVSSDARPADYRRVFYTRADKTIQLVQMAPQFMVPPEAHSDTAQYFLVKRGSGWIIIGGRVSRLSVGSAVWVFPNMRHAILSDPSNPLSLFVTYAPAHHPAGTVNRYNVDIAEIH